MKSARDHLSIARRLVYLMDLRFQILGIRFGFDPLLTIIPGIGNLISASISLYLFWIAWKLGVGVHIYIYMAGNIFVDYLFGLFPTLGVVFDVFFRANVRNYELLKSYTQ